MSFHFPVKLHKGSSTAMLTAMSVDHLPTGGMNCDCVAILTNQVAGQAPGMYLHDGVTWRFALDKTQLDSCVIFGRAIELYYQLDKTISITAPSLIFRNTLPVKGTNLEVGSTAVFAVLLMPDDTNPASWAPLFSPVFQGTPTAATAEVGTSTNQLATTEFVTQSLSSLPEGGVVTFNQRSGIITLLSKDVIDALGYGPVDPANAVLTNTPTAPTAEPGTSSDQLATTAFVASALASLPPGGVVTFNTRTGDVTLLDADVLEALGYTPVDPSKAAFTNTPTAPTAAAGTSTTQLATTAFVTAAVAAAPVKGVAAFNNRTGEVSLVLSDVTGAGGAPLNSPALTGVPTAPTPPANDVSGKIATTAFVQASIAAIPESVSSFNTRKGDVTLTITDITGAGGAPIAGPIFTGSPKAPTPATTDSSSNLATTAFVKAAMAASPPGGVTSVNNRTGEVSIVLSDFTDVGGAPLNSPGLTGTPTAPTPAAGNISGRIATTAFVQAALSALPPSGVSAFNTRTGDIVLELLDVTGVGGAPVADPTFTGKPRAPTPTLGDSSTQLATTAFVQTAVAGAGVASFNTRTGAVTLTLADITTVGGAPLASPAFTGTPTAPTQAASDSSTKIATTAFVQAGRVLSGLSDVMLSSPLDGQVLTYVGGKWLNVDNSGGGGGGVAGVSHFNTRSGAVTLTLADVTTALGYTPLQTALEDAPSDGKMYGRRDATWSVVDVPETALGPLQSVMALDAVSMIQDDGTGTGTAVLRVFKSSPSIGVVEENGIISFEGMASVGSVNGISPIDGDVPLTAADVAALPVDGGTMQGNIDMGGFTLSGLADPVNAGDAVTLNSLSLTTFDPGEY